MMMTPATTTNSKGDGENDSHNDNDNNNTDTDNDRQHLDQLQTMLHNLTEVETSLHRVLKDHRNGYYGHITREWGFLTPGGVFPQHPPPPASATNGRSSSSKIVQLEQKFDAWQSKLDKCKTFFWPVQAYEAMNDRPFGQPDPDHITKFNIQPYQHETLYNNPHLHQWLQEPPQLSQLTTTNDTADTNSGNDKSSTTTTTTATTTTDNDGSNIILFEDSELDDYKVAARAMILLGTLSHLFGNSAVDAPRSQTAVLPLWIERPLIQVSQRLNIEPTLSGHFLVQENWIWKSDSISTTTDVISREDHTGNDSTLPAAVKTIDNKEISHRLSLIEDGNENDTANPLPSRDLATSASAWTSRRIGGGGNGNASAAADRRLVMFLLQNVVCDDRRYRIKIYPDCFVGNHVVDLILSSQSSTDKSIANINTNTGQQLHTTTFTSREDVVRAVRRVNEKYRLFAHVTDDHLFIDKHLFYRFHRKWKDYRDDPESLIDQMDRHDRRRNRGKARQNRLERLQMDHFRHVVSPTNGTGGDFNDAPFTDDNDRSDDSSEESGIGPSTNQKYLPDRHATSQTSRLMNFSDLHNLPKSLRAVSFGRSTSHGTAKSGGANSSGSSNGSLRKFSHNNGTKTNASTQIVQPSRTSLPSEQQSTTFSVKQNGPLHNQGASLRSASSDDSASMNLRETMSIIAIMGNVPVKDRRYRLRVYKQCFVASELIDVMIQHDVAVSRQEAVEIARTINRKYKLMHHVVDNHLIKDEYLFFRFTDAFQAMVDSGEGSTYNTEHGSAILQPQSSSRRASDKHIRIANDSSVGITSRIVSEMLDENLTRSLDGSLPDGSIGSSMASYDDLMDFDDAEEFRLDNITMLYPAFGTEHEKVNQLVPACMGYALRGLPFLIIDIISAMRNVLEAEIVAKSDTVDDSASVQSYESKRLYDLLYKVAFSLSRSKEEFQQMSTDPSKRAFNSKYISIKQTQPLSNGVLVRRSEDAEPALAKGTTGTHFPYFHLLDWLLGRFQYDGNDSPGLVAKVAQIDDSFPKPQRDFIGALSNLEKGSTLRAFMEIVPRQKQLLTAYNHVIECYGGEGGILQAHSRKLYSYIHNDVQFSTSGTNHLKAKEKDDSAAASQGTENSPRSVPSVAEGCPMHSISTERNNQTKISAALDNHNFALTMFKHMQKAAHDRWKLRLPPLMTEVEKTVYSTSDSGGFTTVALDLDQTGLQYEYGDVVKILIPNGEKTTMSWMHSLSSSGNSCFKLNDMLALHKQTVPGWGWTELWEALNWHRFEDHGGNGVPLEVIAQYIEQGQIQDADGRTRWVNSPLDLRKKGESKYFYIPPSLALDRVLSLEPTSPRVYSVSGVESSRVFLLVSRPLDGARHHGYEGMSDHRIRKVHCSFSPATFFLVPPKDSNLVCVCSGTGVSPFVGLASAIDSRSGSYTIVHQCRSSDLFMANSQSWLDFTAVNPGAVVFGYISGDRSRRNCPMRYIVRNGAIEETTVLRRRTAQCYYFECEFFQSAIQETYKKGGLNLAYCCGGYSSAIKPFQNFAEREGLEFEYTLETYGVSPSLSTESVACQIGSTVVNLDHVSPIHPGGDQILHQLDDIVTQQMLEGESSNGLDELRKGNHKSAGIPDHSAAFYELHPHAYNLHRCLRTPLDADSDAFSAFLERQAMSKSVVTTMAKKYAQVALSRVQDTKVLKIAAELQSSVIKQETRINGQGSSDIEMMNESASYLESLLDHIPEDDPELEKWKKILEEFRGMGSPGMLESQSNDEDINNV